MPMMMKRRVVLAKIEATYGTDAAPTGAANAILVRSLSVTPLQQVMASRDLIRPFLGQFEQLPSEAYSMLEMEVELAGSGTAGTVPPWGALMRACGFSEVVTATTNVKYSPVSSSFESLSLYANYDGVMHKMTGARGTVSLEMKEDAIPVMKFKFTGLWNAVTDAALPAATYTAWQRPLPVNRVNTSGFQLHSFATAQLQQASIDMANDVQFRSLVGGQDTVFIVDRKTSGSLVLQAEPQAVKDWYTPTLSAALGNFSITHGTVAGNKVQLDAPRVQLTNPQYQEDKGIAMLQFGMNLMPNTGNDELVVTVS